MITNWPVPTQLFINEKPGIRYYLIMAALSQLPSELDQQAYHQEALKIRNAFDEKIEIAKRYHEEGNISQAVAIFEQLMEDGYDQVYPYAYLKEYYASEGKLAEEKRVARLFLDLVQMMQDKGINRPDLII